MEELIGGFIRAVLEIARFILWLFWEGFSEYLVELTWRLVTGVVRLIAKLGRFICQGVINLTQALRYNRSIE